jgi:hypothetical protein
MHVSAVFPNVPRQLPSKGHLALFDMLASAAGCDPLLIRGRRMSRSSKPVLFPRTATLSGRKVCALSL